MNGTCSHRPVVQLNMRSVMNAVPPPRVGWSSTYEGQQSAAQRGHRSFELDLNRRGREPCCEGCALKHPSLIIAVADVSEFRLELGAREPRGAVGADHLKIATSPYRPIIPATGSGQRPLPFQKPRARMSGVGPVRSAAGGPGAAAFHHTSRPGHAKKKPAERHAPRVIVHRSVDSAITRRSRRPDRPAGGPGREASWRR